MFGPPVLWIGPKSEFCILSDPPMYSFVFADLSYHWWILKTKNSYKVSQHDMNILIMAYFIVISK